MKKRTPIGEMRKRVAIQRIDTTRTESGETVDVAVLFCMAWVKIEPLTGREAWLAKEQQSTTTHRLNMRYQRGITSKMQAVYQGRVFSFTDVRDIDELHEELEIMAIEAQST